MEAQMFLNTFRKTSKPGPDPNPFDRLPDEILVRIFSMVPKADLLKVRDTCVRFSRVGEERCLWRTINFGDYDPLKLPEYFAVVASGGDMIEKITCGKATSSFLEEVVTLCPNLTHLILPDPRPCTAESLELVRDACPHLGHLEMGTPGKDDGGEEGCLIEWDGGYDGVCVPCGMCLVYIVLCALLVYSTNRVAYG